MTPEPERYLTVAQVRERVPLSRDSLYRAIRRGELPATQRCGRLLIRDDDLAAWLDAGQVKAERRELPTEHLRITAGPLGGLRDRGRAA